MILTGQIDLLVHCFCTIECGPFLYQTQSLDSLIELDLKKLFWIVKNAAVFHRGPATPSATDGSHCLMASFSRWCDWTKQSDPSALVGSPRQKVGLFRLLKLFFQLTKMSNLIIWDKYWNLALMTHYSFYGDLVFNCSFENYFNLKLTNSFGSSSFP